MLNKNIVLKKKQLLDLKRSMQLLTIGKNSFIRSISHKNVEYASIKKQKQ
jgi:hypothetical protein